MEKDLDNGGPERLVSGGMWFLGLMVLSGLFWLLWGVVLSRVYGPSAYGLFCLAQSVFDFIWVFIFGGIFEGLIQFGSGYLTTKGSNLSQYFSNYVRYLTFMSVIVFIFLVILSLQISDVIMRIIFLSLAFSFLFSGTKDSLASIIGSLQKSKQLSIINSSGVYAVSILGIIFIMFNLHFHFLPILILFATVCQLLLCMYFLRPYLKDLILFNVDFFRQKNIKQSILKDLKQFKQIFIFGFFVSIGKLSFNVMKSLDIVVLKLFFDYADLGVYTVADTASSILFSMTAFSLPIIASISKAWTQKDNILLEKYVKISVKYPLILGIPSMVIILTLAEPIIVGIYGVAFQEAVVPLQILIIGTFLLMFGYTLSSILIGIGKPKLSGVLLAGAAVQYIFSLFILAPALGFEGAAISLTLTGVTSLFLIPFFIKYNLKINIFEGSQKVLFSGAVLAGFLFLIPKSNFPLLILGTVVGIVLYVLLLRVTGYIKDINLLKNLRVQS